MPNRRKTKEQHLAEIVSHGRVELVGEFLGNERDTYYLCLRHDEVYTSKPCIVARGWGLECCARHRAQEANQRKRDKAAATYDEDLAKFGKVIRLEEYIDKDTPIYHLCLKHQKHFEAAPNHCKKGQGLRCCMLEANRERGREKDRKNAESFQERLANYNPTLVWVSGEYITCRSVLNFYCTRHNEVHPAKPKDVLQRRLTGPKKGHKSGIKCCHIAQCIANGKKVGPALGRKYGPIYSAHNGKTNDTVWRALSGTLAYGGNCELYLHESPNPKCSKYGISSNKKRRSSQGKYGPELIAPRFFPDRSDCVLIEQAFKFGWGLQDIPEDLRDWTGKTELTQLPPAEFESIISELESELISLGKWQFAEKYCDPAQVKRARSVVKSINEMELD
ncbi:hypothetical protein [Synechococcus sp. A15-24]|uniref:hypothetical protein n=1 Tax=Synechococcus sp. A15-24 TaxID=1050635 RepID=UPI0016450AAC|nr:hypothetical protein [Synechococcus sp. A15-24]QNJ29759.1 hypothetical protein SynA1524_02072 [Synechococcus sp. A15-24]